MYPALLSLFLGAFAIGTTEFVAAGLLPAIAGDLGVSIPDAGFLITGYALSVAVGGPLLVVALGRLPRKPALMGVMALFVAGHALSALAPSFGALLLGRAVAAVAHGAFFGVALLVASAIAPPGRRGMAIAIVIGGVNIANVVGVPAGTAVGGAFGWRAAFWMVGAIAAVAAAAMAAFLPAIPGRSGGGGALGAQVRALGNRRVVTSYLLIILAMAAFWSLGTFVAPYFGEVAGVGEDRLPLVLLGFGLFGTLGIIAGGRYADRQPIRSITFTYPVAALALAVAWVVTARAWPVGAGAIGLVLTATSISAVALQNRILSGAAAAPELASGLISAVYNVGIAAGAGLGSALLARGMPIGQMPLVGAILLAAGSALAVVATRGEARVGRAPPAG
ncbi:MAG: MFS transporter [Amaricoccus sp.]|uniref:MFS transporter n=1 Tax=Amaricoccus sp. TaxID=1872485 RepID=UPI0039E692E7